MLTKDQDEKKINYMGLSEMMRMIIFVTFCLNKKRKETCLFFLGCPVCWHIIIYGILLWFFFLFLWYQLLFLLFHFLFCLFGSSLFSSWWAWPEDCRFCLPFQRASSWFYWFFSIVFLISILFISALTFIISFLLLTLGFVCSSFSNSFR